MQDASGNFIGPECEAKDPGRRQLGLKKDVACLWNWLLSHPVARAIGWGKANPVTKAGLKSEKVALTLLILSSIDEESSCSYTICLTKTC